MIGHQHGEGRVDLLAVQRDDELLDRIAGRHPLAMTDPDATLLLLQALAEQVDDGLAEVLAAADATPDEAIGGLEAVPTPTPEPARLRRGAAWGAALAVAVGATLSSGVAAAVTGDPLAPYRAVGGMLSSFGDGGLPATAADVAHVNKALAGTRVAIARGELSGVQARIDALRASLPGLDLTDAQRAVLERKLDRLEESLARAAASPAERGNGHAREPGSGAKGKPGSGDSVGTGSSHGAKPGHDKPAKDKGAQETKTDDGGDEPAGSEQPAGSDVTGATDSEGTAEVPDDGASSGQEEEVTEPAGRPGKQKADGSAADKKAAKSSTLRQEAPGQLRR